MVQALQPWRQLGQNIREDGPRNSAPKSRRDRRTGREGAADEGSKLTSLWSHRLPEPADGTIDEGDKGRDADTDNEGAEYDRGPESLSVMRERSPPRSPTIASCM